MFESVPFAARVLQRGRAVLALAALAVLSACGGSVSRVESFAPQRLVVFGDELSLVRSDGSKYSINALKLDSTGAVALPAAQDCASNPIWTQYLASSFGLVFAECGGGSTAVMRAQAGSISSSNVVQTAVLVADVVQQVAAYRSAGGTFNSKTLVTVQGGMYDVLAAYNGYLLAGETAAAHDAALGQVAAAGVALGGLVNSVADNGNGGRVLYASVPNLLLSPFGIAENLVNTARGTLLKDLSNTLNERLRVTVLNDGRYAGPVWIDARVQSMVTFPITGTGYYLNDVVDPACTTALPNCTVSTLQLADATSNPAKVAATSVNYLWADNFHIGPAAHTMVGADAVNRARNNPF